VPPECQQRRSCKKGEKVLIACIWYAIMLSRFIWVYCTLINSPYIYTWYSTLWHLTCFAMSVLLWDLTHHASVTGFPRLACGELINSLALCLVNKETIVLLLMTHSRLCLQFRKYTENCCCQISCIMSVWCLFRESLETLDYMEDLEYMYCFWAF
jgi:hypothetical protein